MALIVTLPLLVLLYVVRWAYQLTSSMYFAPCASVINQTIWEIITFLTFKDKRRLQGAHTLTYGNIFQIEIHQISYRLVSRE